MDLAASGAIKFESTWRQTHCMTMTKADMVKIICVKMGFALKVVAL